MKVVVSLLESGNRTRLQKKPEPRVQKSKKSSKKSKKSRPVREPARAPSVESLSVSDESEREGSDSEGSEREEMQPNQPLEFYFKSSEFPQSSKIQTKCFVTRTVKLIRDKPEAAWFTSHPQFRHFFHMPDEDNLKLQGMWMLLLRTICTPEDDVAWFAVNGVPIRYSMREHALISGLDCGDYPPNYEKLGGYKFVDYYFHDRKKITITDVKQKMLSMPPCPDRLKMTVLFFLGRVIRGKPKDAGNLDDFILRMMDDLDACRSFPWGRLTFEDAIKEIKHVMNHLKGEVKEACAFPGFIIPLEVLAFECIPDLGKTFRIYSEDASEECPRMCKSRFTKSSLRGYPLEDIYAAVGETKVINSVLVPTIGEQIMLARIIDEEREYDRQGSPSDTWNYWLNVKQKNIWWEELYELDQAARGVLPKKKDKEKVTFAEGSSSNSGLDSRLQGLEERILEFMGERFVGLHVTVETMLEAQSSRMSVLEKNQRLLRRRAKKIEDRLTSIESKVEPSHGEDMDFRQWDNDTYEEKDKACSEKEKANAEHEAGKEKDNIENTEEEGEKEKENSEADEEEDNESESEELKQMKERSRRQAAKLWKEIANEEKIGGKHDEEESEEKEAETSEEKDENNDEKDEEKVVESEAEGKMIKEKEKEKNETEEVESEARETEIEKGTPTPPRGNQTERTPKDDDNEPRVEPRVETNRTGETPTPPHGSQSEGTPKVDDTEPRVETNRTGETPTPPRGSQSEGTPTPPRGRTKAMAARRPIIRRMEDEPGKGEKVVEEEKQKKEAVETEEKSREKVADEEKKKEEVVKEHAEEVVEEYSEEEKQRWIMVVYKEAPSPWIMHRCKENVVVAAPKKSGRPKRKSQWVQTPFTEGKKRKTKP
ncbi:uncharacterized protein At3g43530-like [Brassica rapa]|uniref:uncharacterized protein At3g43530-like n=1 Tax=Brassica campestris TaxID=3711 RepID=UPI00142D451E|nr:uncharacterized protein At3g43530-like [Brassica rapa]